MKGMTIYDIAKLAGVSPSTVSRVLHDSPSVRQTTRERVRQVLDGQRFEPDAAARGDGAAPSSRLAGILVPDVRSAHVSGGVYCLERELARDGCCSLVFNTGADERQIGHSLRQLARHRPDAVVLFGPQYQTEGVRQAVASCLPQTPAVLCGGTLELENGYSVLAGEEFGAAGCVELFASRGKDHPALVMGGETPAELLLRQGFCYAALRFLHQPNPPVCLLEAEEEAGEATARLMREHPETDAILYFDDALAAAGLRALLDMGRRVPQQVAVIAAADSPCAALCIPKITALGNLAYEQGLAAARTLRAVFAGEHTSRRMMVYAELIERETT